MERQKRCAKNPAYKLLLAPRKRLDRSAGDFCRAAPPSERGRLFTLERSDIRRDLTPFVGLLLKDLRLDADLFSKVCDLVMRDSVIPLLLGSCMSTLSPELPDSLTASSLTSPFDDEILASCRGSVGNEAVKNDDYFWVNVML